LRSLCRRSSVGHTFASLIVSVRLMILHIVMDHRAPQWRAV
jgi:hypothetical protein